MLKKKKRVTNYLVTLDKANKCVRVCVFITLYMRFDCFFRVCIRGDRHDASIEIARNDHFQLLHHLIVFMKGNEIPQFVYAMYVYIRARTRILLTRPNLAYNQLSNLV